ncbi:CCR4-NOT transcription complex subunit 3-like isoform X2 [Dreissena polymorpha]|uniref:CCR4-NOT transcription complex subunit 3-like isoform X2 n=1 Tax=Dreissena polymorpha TaxID=45954 RepID=UPI0022655935|nr:CCR4-NOT transcription complex subunit 3-like isoform X2 [Dreissena polymorpha]
MSDKRKLQGEIERCLKKVQEGVETFEDIWQKVYSSANANQKEKYEADLKKEIKKLQRLRDQIKTWLASSDVKDKRILTDSRKLIETQMERFKVVERETKTKAYSKEGLGSASKLDPLAKEKLEMTTWLSRMIDSLNIQMDKIESEVEQLTSGNKKKKMDKEKHDRYESLKTQQERHTFHVQKLETIMRMLDNDAISIDRIKPIKEDVEFYVESSQDHDFEENEFVYDELDLDNIEPALLNATSPPHDEDRFSDKLSTTPTSTNSSSPSPSPGIVLNHSKEEDRKKHKAMEENKNKNNSTSSSSNSSDTSISKMPSTPTKINSYDFILSMNSLSAETNSNHLPNSTPSNHSWLDGMDSNSGSPLPSRTQNIVVPPSSVWQRNPSTSTSGSRHLNFSENASQSSDSKSQSNALTNHVSGHTSASVSNSISSSNVLVNSVTSSKNATMNSVSSNSVGNPAIPPSESPLLSNGPAKEPTPPMSSVLLTASFSSSLSVSSSLLLNSNNNSIVNSLSSSISPPTPTQAMNAAMNGLSAPSKSDILPAGVLNGPSSAGGALHDKDSLESMSSLKSIAQQAVMNAGLENQIPSSTVPSATADTKVPFLSSVSQLGEQASPGSQDGSSLSGGMPVPLTKAIQLNQLFSVAPLGPVPLQDEHIYQLTMGKAGFRHLPYPSDSERIRVHLPRKPCPTPSYYPQLPPMHADTVEFFQRLSTETLFFIFYYMEGTKAQYLAAKALKKQSWRFHTKYMMWFQRHEEPKTINEDYEQGTYIYFDYEKWGQRKKEGFTFEYRYLEDRDLN